MLAPIYAAVVLYTLWKCVKERLSRTLPVAVVIVPLLIFAFNTAVNYRETGEIIPISNYAADAVCFALNPNSTIWTSQAQFHSGRHCAGRRWKFMGTARCHSRKRTARFMR